MYGFGNRILLRDCHRKRWMFPTKQKAPTLPGGAFFVYDPALLRRAKRLHAGALIDLDHRAAVQRLLHARAGIDRRFREALASLGFDLHATLHQRRAGVVCALLGQPIHRS